ncbi:alpha/beta hydrolase, partial [Pseudomonas syringae]
GGGWQRPRAAPYPPLVLSAHSLGGVAVAPWAPLAPLEALRQVQGALRVAPADVGRPNCPPAWRNFAPIPADLLPFPTQIVSSANDPAVSSQRAMEMARHWGAAVGSPSQAGHINVKSCHQRWEQGFAYLYRRQHRLEHHAPRRA